MCLGLHFFHQEGNIEVVMPMKSRNTLYRFVCYRAHKRFRELRPDLLPKRMTAKESVSIRVPLENVIMLPELWVILIVLLWFFNII